ncbi:integrase core domain-containing protein [Amaricoccus sp.]|uniref:integrase core domain-containing protein n=1 Tax=Amaricoccus sp. TaxID=1872485 RepID=UPI0039E3F319
MARTFRITSTSACSPNAQARTATIRSSAPIARWRRASSTLAEARAVIERWRLDYNLVRPHSAHGGLTPDAVRNDPAAGCLRHPNRSDGRPLPSGPEPRYQSKGLSQ